MIREAESVKSNELKGPPPRNIRERNGKGGIIHEREHPLKKK